MTRRYPAYRSTGIAWLPEVPSHWATLRLKNLFDIQKRPVEEGDGIVTAFRDGVVTLRSNRREDGFTNAIHEIGYQGIRRGDLVIHAMDGFAGAIGVSDSDGKSTPVYSVCQPKEAVSSYFYGRLLRHMALAGFVTALAKGVRERSTEFRWADASVLPLPVPPLHEQTAIAAFLDRETAKIDALVAEQRRLIDLLKEKRQAVISRAVTRGLNPAAKLKPSSVDWLGDVPERWEVIQLRRVIKAFEQGYSPECFAYPAAPGEWGVLKSGCVNRGIYREEENKTVPLEVEPRPQWEVREGDLLMSRASGSPELIGSVAIVESTQGRIMMSDKIFRLRLDSILRTDFAYWMFASDGLRTQIVNAISGGDGMANNLPQSSIKEFLAALPPEQEQAKIAAFLRVEVERLDLLTATAEAAITLLQERRAALISAAVTGKIDVRDLATQHTEAA
jgi:type I restriction enzyme S subunit